MQVLECLELPEVWGAGGQVELELDLKCDPEAA